MEPRPKDRRSLVFGVCWLQIADRQRLGRDKVGNARAPRNQILCLACAGFSLFRFLAIDQPGDITPLSSNAH